MTPPQRMRAWGAGVSAGHLVLGALGWVLFGVPPLFFVLCAIVTLAGALLAAPLLRRPPDDGDDDGGGDDGGSGPDGEPPWWPGFERDFRAYCEARRRALH